MFKILLIDDEESIIKVLSISLRSENYDIISAYSGNEGIKRFRKESPDIVITDIKMPGMDGIEVLKKMKELNPEAEVIIITGHGDMDSAIEALHFGASDFINKPIRDEVLTIALERAKEKITIRQRLKEYTEDLENMIKVATEEVRRKSEFQAKLISSSNDGIVATNEEDKIIIYNPGAEKIFGYPRSEVIRNMSFNDLYTPGVAKEILKRLKQKINVDGLSWKEVAIVSKNGEMIPTRFSGSTLYERKKAIGNVAFFQDLREIKALEKELIKSERLAAVGQTIAGLAHYIKNILSGLKGGYYVANIGFDKKDIKKMEKGWLMIQKNIARISDLVMNLLTYSKERKPEYENCFPNEIAKEVCELMENKATENNVKIKMDLDQSINEVSMDSQAIHRSLLNLISNAIDACIFDEETNKKYVVHVKSALQDENTIRFDVKDNGCGMNEEIQANLFSSFFSTKHGKGTGLGLLVTRKLIEEHGGKINFTSKNKKGSTFTIMLPYKTINKGIKKIVNK